MDAHWAVSTLACVYIALTGRVSRNSSRWVHFPDRESLLDEVIAIGEVRFNTIAERTDDLESRIAIARMAAQLWREASTVQAMANIALNDAHVAKTVQALKPVRRRLRQLTHQGIALGTFRNDLTHEMIAFLVEETARATLRELRSTTNDGEAIVVRVVLSIIGMSWTEQLHLTTERPEIPRPSPAQGL